MDRRYDFILDRFGPPDRRSGPLAALITVTRSPPPSFMHTISNRIQQTVTIGTRNPQGSFEFPRPKHQMMPFLVCEGPSRDRTSRCGFSTSFMLPLLVRVGRYLCFSWYLRRRDFCVMGRLDVERMDDADTGTGVGVIGNLTPVIISCV